MRITLIEGIVIFVIILIVTSTAYQAATSSIQVGLNGVTETRCIEGYKFVLGADGNPRQILDEFGKGARCEQKFTK